MQVGFQTGQAPLVDPAAVLTGSVRSCTPGKAWLSGRVWDRSEESLAAEHGQSPVDA